MIIQRTAFRPAMWATVAAILFATVLAAPSAGANSGACSDWDTNPSDIGDFNATIARSTDARRGPSSHGTCDRGWDYSKGTNVRVTGQSGNYYWLTNTATGDWAWIKKSDVSTGDSGSTPLRSDGATCNGWNTTNQDIGDFNATIARSTDARRGPSSHGTCDRGWDYSKGTNVRVTGQSGDFYWLTDTATGDLAWIKKSDVSTGSSSRPVQRRPAADFEFVQAPIPCNNDLHAVGVATGFLPNEPVVVTINGKEYLRNADSNGNRTINWRCGSGNVSVIAHVAGRDTPGFRINFNTTTNFIQVPRAECAGEFDRFIDNNDVVYVCDK